VREAHPLAKGEATPPAPTTRGGSGGSSTPTPGVTRMSGGGGGRAPRAAASARAGAKTATHWALQPQGKRRWVCSYVFLCFSKAFCSISPLCRIFGYACFPPPLYVPKKYCFKGKYKPTVSVFAVVIRDHSIFFPDVPATPSVYFSAPK